MKKYIFCMILLFGAIGYFIYNKMEETRNAEKNRDDMYAVITDINGDTYTVTAISNEETVVIIDGKRERHKLTAPILPEDYDFSGSYTVTITAATTLTWGEATIGRGELQKGSAVRICCEKDNIKNSVIDVAYEIELISN